MGSRAGTPQSQRSAAVAVAASDTASLAPSSVGPSASAAGGPLRQQRRGDGSDGEGDGDAEEEEENIFLAVHNALVEGLLLRQEARLARDAEAIAEAAEADAHRRALGNTANADVPAPSSGGLLGDEDTSAEAAASELNGRSKPSAAVGLRGKLATALLTAEERDSAASAAGSPPTSPTAGGGGGASLSRGGSHQPLRGGGSAGAGKGGGDRRRSSLLDLEAGFKEKRQSFILARQQQCREEAAAATGNPSHPPAIVDTTILLRDSSTARSVPLLSLYGGGRAASSAADAASSAALPSGPPSVPLRIRVSLPTEEEEETATLFGVRPERTKATAFGHSHHRALLGSAVSGAPAGAGAAAQQHHHPSAGSASPAIPNRSAPPTLLVRGGDGGVYSQSPSRPGTGASASFVNARGIGFGGVGASHASSPPPSRAGAFSSPLPTPAASSAASPPLAAADSPSRSSAEPTNIAPQHHHQHQHQHHQQHQQFYIDTERGEVVGAKRFNLVPHVSGITEKQRALRAMLPSIDFRQQRDLYRTVVAELAENEEILRLRRVELQQRVLRYEADKLRAAAAQQRQQHAGECAAAAAGGEW